MSEQQFVGLLAEALELWADENAEGSTPDEQVEVRGTFHDLGLMTTNKGLVVRVGDSEFQVTVVRSR